MHLEGHNHCFMHFFGVRTLSGTPVGLALNATGYGARYGAHRRGAVDYTIGNCPWIREIGNWEQMIEGIPRYRCPQPLLPVELPQVHFCLNLLHLHPPYISMQVMARAENTVFLRVEGKETNLEIFTV